MLFTCIPDQRGTGKCIPPSSSLRQFQRLSEQNEAVTRFADWLTTLTVQRENKLGRGAGSAKIVLCGHRYALRFFSLRLLMNDSL